MVGSIVPPDGVSRRAGKKRWEKDECDYTLLNHFPSNGGSNRGENVRTSRYQRIRKR